MILYFFPPSVYWLECSATILVRCFKSRRQFVQFNQHKYQEYMNNYLNLFRRYLHILSHARDGFFFSFFQTSWSVCFCTYRTYYLTDLSLSFPSHLGRPVSLFMRLQETICSKLNVLIFFFFYSTYVSECLKWCENWNLPLLSRWPIQACGWFG